MDDNGKLTLHIDELDNMVDVDNALTENEIKPGQHSNPNDKNQSTN